MKQFMPEVSYKERTIIMQENAAKVEDTSYQKILTDEELAERREYLAENCIKLDRIEDEFKEVKADFKLKTDPLKMVHKDLLLEIKTKQVTTEGLLYHMPNYDDGMMEIYDSEGILISSRRLRPDEKVGTLFSLKKAM